MLLFFFFLFVPLNRKAAGEQDVQLMNDYKVMTQKKAQQSKPVDQGTSFLTFITFKAIVYPNKNSFNAIMFLI